MESIMAKSEKSLYQRFEDFILTKFHPCLMARSALKSKHVDFHSYNVDDKNLATAVLNDLKGYIAKVNAQPKHFFSYIATFPNLKINSEAEFEKFLWNQLQMLHEADPNGWDKAVSSDPASSEFSMSLLGNAFYIVGMHPHSSRKARQAPVPTLVFNLHQQFEKLRELGLYDNLKAKIRNRDVQHQGHINPMLEDFGDSSEARQYSGRKVSSKWKCPFHRK